MIRILYLCAFVVLFPLLGGAGSVSVSTTYPAPTGIYNALTANNVSVGTTAAAGTAKFTIMNGKMGIGTEPGLADLTIKSTATTNLHLIPIPPGFGGGPNSQRTYVSFRNANNTGGYVMGRDLNLQGFHTFFILDQTLGARFVVTEPGAVEIEPGYKLSVGKFNPAFTTDVVGTVGSPGSFALTTCPDFGCPAGPGDKFIVTPSGNVGIGQPNPTFKLQVNGNIKSSGTLTMTGAAGINLSTGGIVSNGLINAVNVTASGDLSLTGNMSTLANLTADGNLTANGSLTVLGASTVAGGSSTQWNMVVQGDVYANSYSPSDGALKMNVHPLTGSLERTLRMQPVRFTWKKDARRDLGLLAQDLERIAPETVAVSPTGMKAVAYNKLVVYLVGAIQEQRKELLRLAQELKALEEGRP